MRTAHFSDSGRGSAQPPIGRLPIDRPPPPAAGGGPLPQEADPPKADPPEADPLDAPPVDRQSPVKYYLAPNFVCGR